jgi:hypothetical protein
MMIDHQHLAPRSTDFEPPSIVRRPPISTPILALDG